MLLICSLLQHGFRPVFSIVGRVLLYSNKDFVGSFTSRYGNIIPQTIFGFFGGEQRVGGGGDFSVGIPSQIVYGETPFPRFTVSEWHMSLFLENSEVSYDNTFEENLVNHYKDISVEVGQEWNFSNQKFISQNSDWRNFWKTNAKLCWNQAWKCALCPLYHDTCRNESEIADSFAILYTKEKLSSLHLKVASENNLIWGYGLQIWGEEFGLLQLRMLKSTECCRCLLYHHQSF